MVSKLGTLGRISGQLPQPDMIVTRSNWSVYLPDSFRYGTPSSNLRLVVSGVAIILAFSWRHAWAILALVVLVFVSVPGLLFVRRRPEDYGMLPDGADPDAAAAPIDSAAAQRESVEQAMWTVREALRTRTLWLVIFTMSAMGFAQTATNLHAAASFQERGISFAASATIVFIFAMTSALTTFPWGWLIDRLHIRYVMMLTALLYVGSMFIIASADSYADAVFFGLVFGSAAGAWTLGFRLLIPNYFGRRSTGAIRGATAPFMAFVGPTGPLLAGIIRDATGEYTLAFNIFAGVFGLAFVSMMLAKPPKHPRATAAAPIKPALLPSWAVCRRPPNTRLQPPP